MALEVEPAPTGCASPALNAVPTLGADSIVIALVNNMPDSALSETELQFTTLLRAASERQHIRLRYSSLPGMPRGTAAQSRMAKCYWRLDDIYRDPPDALIVTGTEPRAPKLSDEPYWGQMVELLEFAQAQTASSIWSCLAAHAAVHYLDGIERRPLTDKRSGVYAHTVLAGDPLTAGLPSVLSTPHSRWNDVSVDALMDAGYTMLSHSAENGADAFAKPGRNPMIFFQGHPEYRDRTLLKEYQRDVVRFVSGKQRHYPSMPDGYFASEAQTQLAEFERRVRANQFTEPLASFPFMAAAESLVNRWSAPAALMFRNWLMLVAAKKNRSETSSHHATRAQSRTRTGGR